MTREQKLWLDANPQFGVCGRPASMTRYEQKGVLFPDGKYTPGFKLRPSHQAEGAFEVAVQVMVDLNNPAERARAAVNDPRGNANERGYDRQGGGTKV